MKKIASIILAVIVVISMILTVAPGSVIAGDGGKNGNLNYHKKPTNEERNDAAVKAKVARLQAAAAGVQLAALLPVAGGTPDYFGIYPNYANSPLPSIDLTGNVVAGTGIRKFVDSLPGLGPTGANNLGQYIPVATPDTITYPGADYYEIAAVQYSEKMHSDLPPTIMRGYVQLNNGTNPATLQNTVAPAPVHYLGPLIVATKDKPVRIKFTNLLPLTTSGGDMFVPVDTTIMGAGTGPNGGTENYTDNRAVIHLHGGLTPWVSDGTPHQWVVPFLQTTSYPEGVSTQDVPDMPVQPGGSVTLYYTNQQSARLMFYHDHALGETRLNVYDGLAAGYLLTDATEQSLVAAGAIPATQIPLVIQDKTYVPQPAQLAAEDPTWDTTKWGGFGSLWFPHVYMTNQNPWDITGANPMGRWDYGPWFWPPFTGLQNGPVANPYYTVGGTEPPQIPGIPNPSITPESFMDTPIVNGTVYPTLTVQPQAYRFRILSAANDRMFNLQFYKAAPLTIGLTNQGSGYTSVPAVSIIGGSVTGATATAVLGVVGFTITAPGSGYTTAPTVTVSGGGGAGALGQAALNPTGGVLGIVVAAPGTGYTSVPSVTLSAPPAGGTQATAAAVLGIIKINVAGGTVSTTGPLVNPKITITGGGGAGATAISSVLTDVAMVPAFNDPTIPFPLDWIAPTDGGSVPSDILNNRVGGVPDPRTMGPSWIQIGTEGGFLPGVVTIPPTPIGYQYNPRNIVIGNVTKHSLFLAPAERADVIVDFSAFAGQTLILYNDSPAPVPAPDSRYDYYTGDLDQTATGGAPTTLPGYGPNTRTIMQIKVASATPVVFNSAAIVAALPTAFRTSQDPIIVPQSAYNTVYGTTYPNDYVRIQDTNFSPPASPQSVASVTLSNEGSGYTSAPTVSLTGGGGSGAAATATLAPAGSITGYTITAIGSGYVVKPTVTITGGGGTGASGDAVILNGILSRIDVVSPGSGYTSAPTVTITGGGGTGAAATATIGKVFNIITAGTGYTSVPTVTLSAPPAGGTQATATASLGLVSVTVLTNGVGYTSAPTITVTGGGGSGAALAPTMSTTGTVTGVTVVSSGSGYTSVPTLTFSGGGASVQATATAALGVVNITVTNAGSGYITAPTVTISGGGGTGATASALNAGLTTGLVGSINVTAAGTGYTSAPTVALAGGGGINAAAYANLTNTITYNLQPKAIQELFTVDYGRMNATLGVELPNSNATTQTTIPYGYIDPPTEYIKDSITPMTPVANDGTQIWKITHNGVDTHVIHFHLHTVQIINRVGWDGAIRAPDPNELGWKESVRANPLEDLIVALRPDAPKLPFGVPDSIRPLAPTLPIGAAMGFFNVAPNGTPVTVTNQLLNFGWEFVWHCHILGHEENDMMRPMIFVPLTNAPSAPNLSVNTTGGNHLSWNDATPATTLNLGNPANEVGFKIQRAVVTGGNPGPYSIIDTAPANVITYIDGTAAVGTTYSYMVTAWNNAGSANSNAVQVNTASAVPLPSVPVMTLPANGSTVSAALPIPVAWTASTGATSYRLQILSGTTVVVEQPGLISRTWNVPNGLLAAGSYTIRVSAIGPSGASAYSTAFAFTVPAATTAPTLVSPANGASVASSAPIVLTWGAVTGATSYAVQVTASGAFSPIVNVSGIATPTYTIPANTLARGTTYSWVVNATSISGTSAWSTAFTLKTLSGAVADFDGDGKTDVAVYRPSTAQWYVLPSSTGVPVLQATFGALGDTPLRGDFDGDGKTDVAVYRPSTAQWYVLPSSTGVPVLQATFGALGDTPVPSDYDGDGKADVAVYRPSTAQWYVLPSSTGVPVLQATFGASGDIPMPRDYDGDKKADVAVYRPSTAQWYVLPSSTGIPVLQATFGALGDAPMPGDFDGDGKVDVAVYRPSTAQWYVLPSSTGIPVLQATFGALGDTPMFGDFDGDGKADVSVFRSSTAQWYVLPSSTGIPVLQATFGVPTDTSIPSLP